MKTVLRALGLFALVTTSMTVPAQAMHGQQERVIVFYDDEEHTNMVGQMIIFCDGHVFRNGTPTINSEETYYGCP